MNCTGWDCVEEEPSLKLYKLIEEAHEFFLGTKKFSNEKVQVPSSIAFSHILREIFELNADRF